MTTIPPDGGMVQSSIDGLSPAVPVVLLHLFHGPRAHRAAGRSDAAEGAGQGAEPVTEPVTGPVAEPVTGPVAEPTDEPVGEAVLVARDVAWQDIQRRSQTLRAVPQGLRGRHRSAESGWSWAGRALDSWPDTLRALVLLCAPLVVTLVVVLVLQRHTAMPGPVSASVGGLAAWALLLRRHTPRIGTGGRRRL